MDSRKEFAHLVQKEWEISSELETLLEKLEIFEEMHLMSARYGQTSLLRCRSFRVELIEDFLNGGYNKTVELYKALYREKKIIQKRICEITENRKDFY